MEDLTVYEQGKNEIVKGMNRFSPVAVFERKLYLKGVTQMIFVKAKIICWG